MDFPRAFIILLGFISLYLALQIYLLVRVRVYVRNRPRREKKWRLLSWLVPSFILLMLFPSAWRLLGLGSYEPYPLVLRSFLGFWAVGSTGSALVLLAHDLSRWASSFFSTPRAHPDSGRRQFLKRSLAVAAAAPFVISGHGVLVERRRFEVDHLDLPLDGLSSSLSQLSIVQLTDIHVGPFMTEEELAAYVEAVNRLKPDVIALTGDFVSATANEVIPCANALSGLKARYGVFACLGNHDAYARASTRLTRLFGEKGIRVLRNDAVSLRIGNTALNILGIDDLRSGRPDLPRALEVARKEPGEVRLLLSHRPEIFPTAARSAVDVVLSGHYHGGQIRLSPDPESLSVARLITPYPEGLFYLPRRAMGEGQKSSVLFVSRGIGVTGLPVRINCSPQIAHLTLRKA